MADVKRRPAGHGTAQETAGRHVTTSIPPADTVTTASQRRPCRLCKTRTRPVVPIGCAAGWDLCYRCFRGVVNLRRHSEPAAVEAWAVRVEELAAAAEARWVA